MSPTVVTIPHKLTREEVRHRLRTRLGELTRHVPGGVAHVESEWPGEDRMALRIGAMGQTISGTIDIEDRAMRVTLMLPPLLGMMSGMIASALQEHGGRLLLDDRRD